MTARKNLRGPYRKRYSTLTFEQRAELFRLYAAGVSYSKIGRAIGRPKTWICATFGRLIRAGAVERRPYRKGGHYTLFQSRMPAPALTDFRRGNPAT